MDVHEYVSVHRCFGLMRQKASAQKRITFEELAILCHLADASGPVCMSDLAIYQDALRPTITHRVTHLAHLGYVMRADGEFDRRNICCGLTKSGKKYLDDVLSLLHDQLQTQEVRNSVSLVRMRSALDAAGAISLSAAELILLALKIDYCQTGKSATIGDISSSLGILQPTVSMAVTLLKDKGLVNRTQGESRANSFAVALSNKGELCAQNIAARIKAA